MPDLLNLLVEYHVVVGGCRRTASRASTGRPYKPPRLIPPAPG